MKTQLPKDELTKNASQMKRQTSAKKISDGCRIHTEKPPIPVERERLQSRNKESQVSDRAADKIRNDGTSCQTLPSAARPPLSQDFSPDRRFNSSLSRKASEDSSPTDDLKSAFLIFPSKLFSGSMPSSGLEEKYEEKKEFDGRIGLGALKMPSMNSWGRE